MRRLILIFAFILCSSAIVAEGQANPRQLADANRVAMDAYNNLEIEVAKETLERAIAGAESNGLTGSGLARTYANLGVVEIGGMSDSAAALEAFIRALQEDPTVEPDPLVSTPEVLSVFNQAKRKAGQGGGRRPKSTPAAPPPPAPVEGNLEHTPAAEQLKNTDLPIFVVASNPEIASMKVFYRSVGMSKPKSANMNQGADGFSFLIPCSDVFEPNVEYFVLAFDAAGEKIGNAGSPENPVSVPIVSVRSQPAPSLPGEVPPSSCGGDDGGYSAVASMGREGALGDTCTDDSQCGEGLVCYDNFCALGQRKKKDDDDDGEASRFYFDLGGGVAATMVSNSTATDSNPPATLLDEAVDEAGNLSGDARIQRGQEIVATNGWNCSVTEVATGGLAFSSCKTTVAAAGFVAVPILSGTIGYFVTPRFALEGHFRFQLKSGAKLGLGGALRGELLLTEPKAEGFHAGLLAGVMLGYIQAKAPPTAKSDYKGPYAMSGIFGAQLGMRLGYMFTPHVGLMVTPAANLMFGNFLFALDLNAGLRFAF